MIKSFWYSYKEASGLGIDRSTHGCLAAKMNNAAFVYTSVTSDGAPPCTDSILVAQETEKSSADLLVIEKCCAETKIVTPFGDLYLREHTIVPLDTNETGRIAALLGHATANDFDRLGHPHLRPAAGF